MEFSSIITSIKTFLMKGIPWMFKKFGYKIVPLDDYKEVVLQVNSDYPAKSEKCIAEKKNGAMFYWSEKYNIGYELYFEIEKIERRYFQWGRQKLWIKRQGKI